MPAGLHHSLRDAGPKRWPNLNRKADSEKPVINKGVEMKTSLFISETSNSEDTEGTITKQPHNRRSKSAPPETKVSFAGTIAFVDPAAKTSFVHERCQAAAPHLR